MAVGLATWLYFWFIEGACGSPRMEAIERWAIEHNILTLQIMGNPIPSWRPTPDA